MTDPATQSPTTHGIKVRPLTPDAFAEFGAVVGRDRFELTSTRSPLFTNIGTLPSSDEPITYVNRHHDHHQVFVTLDGKPMILVVASPRLSASELRLEDIQAFVTDGNTAIVFHVDTWHLMPRAIGNDQVRVLNVQAMDSHAYTERVELADTFGRVLQILVPLPDRE